MSKTSSANNYGTRQDLTATAAKASFKDWRAALAHISESGRKLGKSKFFEDIKRGLLRRQADGGFRLRDLERYMASLPLAGTQDGIAERAQDRQRRKEEAEIRKIEACAKREEFDLAVKMGRYIPREQVHLELAARAVALSLGLKTALEARGLEIISAIDGNPKKSLPLQELLESILDEALNEYSREMEFELEFVEDAEKEAENGES